MDEHIDVVVPRGGKSLIKAISKISKIPVLKHLDGICHTYIDENYNALMAKKVVLNAKISASSFFGSRSKAVLIFFSSSTLFSSKLNNLFSILFSL